MAENLIPEIVHMLGVERIISGESEHTVWINMDNDDFSTVFLSCDTLEGAKRAMDELAKAINKTKGVSKHVEIL